MPVVRIVGLIYFFLAAFSASVYVAPALAEPVTVTDAEGYTRTFSKPPRRIISLAPSITEILFAIGLDSEIVGVTDACNYPDKVQSKSRVGGIHNAGIEQIIGLHPDLILVKDDLSGPEFVQNLRRLNLPVVSLAPNSLAAIQREIQLIGRMTGRSDQAQSLSRDMKRRIQMIKDRVSHRNPVRVLYVLWDEPVMTIGKETFIAELIHLAGGVLVGEATPLSYFRINIETVLGEDPEIILIQDDLGPSRIEAQKKYWRRWPVLQAVKNNRIVVIHSDLVQRPGPRVVLGLERLAELLHPEIFQ